MNPFFSNGSYPNMQPSQQPNFSSQPNYMYPQQPCGGCQQNQQQQMMNQYYQGPQIPHMNPHQMNVPMNPTMNPMQPQNPMQPKFNPYNPNNFH